MRVHPTHSRTFRLFHDNQCHFVRVLLERGGSCLRICLQEIPNVQSDA